MDFNLKLDAPCVARMYPAPRLIKDLINRVMDDAVLRLNQSIRIINYASRVFSLMQEKMTDNFEKDITKIGLEKKETTSLRPAEIVPDKILDQSKFINCSLLLTSVFFFFNPLD